MSMRFFLAMLLAIILTQRLDAQTSTDELATTLDKILQRLDAIELRLRQLEDRDDKQPTTDSVVGRILLPDIAVESLASYFDALRVACQIQPTKFPHQATGVIANDSPSQPIVRLTACVHMP